MKKVVSMFLIIVFVLSVPLSASASTAPKKTFEQAVNEMKLEPLRPSYWDKDFIRAVDNAVKDKKTNYDKMLAAYRYVVNNPVRHHDGAFAGARWQSAQLQCAFEIVGFRTYNLQGYTTARTNQINTGEGHRWVGVDVGNVLAYFDSMLASQLKNMNGYFGIPYRSERSRQLYKNVIIGQMEIAPVTKEFNDWPGLAILDPIPNTAAARRDYRSVPDRVYSLYYVEGKGTFWKRGDTSDYASARDKSGKTVWIDRQGNVGEPDLSWWVNRNRKAS